MPVEVGTHANGERFAKVWLSDRGITATIVGSGPDDDVAAGNLKYKLQQLAEMAEDAAAEVSIEPQPELAAG